jgi:hypothetical protein
MRYQLKCTNEVNSLDKHGYTATPNPISTLMEIHSRQTGIFHRFHLVYAEKNTEILWSPNLQERLSTSKGNLILFIITQY